MICFLVRYIEGFADELLPFDESIDIFQNPDSTAAILATDASLNGENSDLLDASIPDTDSNLFATDNHDLDPIKIGTTFIADCAPSINKFQKGKKARLRR